MFPESSFTKPSKRCPNPHYWHSENTGATEIEVSEFIGALVRLLQPEYCLETGTYQGQTTKFIGEALRANRHGKLVSLETNEDYIKIAKARCEELPVEILHCNSMAFLPPQQIDLAYIDSGDRRADEIKLYYQYMNDGAIICVHDTALEKEWKDELWSMVHRGMLTGINFHTPRGLMLCEVNKL